MGFLIFLSSNLAKHIQLSSDLGKAFLDFKDAALLYSLYALVTHSSLKWHLLRKFPEKYLPLQINGTGFTLGNEMTIQLTDERQVVAKYSPLLQMLAALQLRLF